ncbi:uncharacterized protein LOC116935087 isoform X2 [Daphnia magna]|uniref:uncharacterized protein LOC116935087 isoform X2 n=1 Tax=Daphnia magna TaxID=35525 RepID=UPI001E1BA8DA|nr:uncharacterized protein LOC116935087 isoform X2 [Daphnia magna]
MSHLIVEIPKILPEKGNWIFVAAENWIENDFLYLPDKSYSVAYKTQLLKGGMPPDVKKWDSHPCYKILGTFSTYDEARSNLPRVESGLPILNDFNTGRGQREKKMRKLNLPGESITEVESEEELGSQSTRKAGQSSKKKSPKKPSIVRPTTILPKPPAGLRVSKGKTLKEVQHKEVCEEKASNVQQLKPVNASTIHLSTSEEGSSCNVDLTIQPPTQPEGTICRLDTAVADDSYGTQHFENLHPFSYQNAGGHYNWGMPSYWNGNSQQMNSFYSLPPIQSPSSVLCELGSKHIVADSNRGTSSSAEYSSYPIPTPSPSPDLCQSGNSGAVQQIYRHPSMKRNLPVMPDIEDSLVGVPEKTSRVKGASGNEDFISALAKINDKLNVIEKSIKPVSDDEAAEIQEDIDSLPLKSLEQLHSFEKVLTTDKNIYKKLVSRIRLLGKKNSKNSESDYVRRAWNTVFSDSLSKDVNWLGRRDRRVNNGSGKTGISSCTITKAVEDGIRSNKSFWKWNTNLSFEKPNFICAMQNLGSVRQKSTHSRQMMLVIPIKKYIEDNDQHASGFDLKIIITHVQHRHLH